MIWLTPPDFWQTRNMGSWLLSPLGLLYSSITRWRLANRQPYRPAVPVICVGNVTLGGVGKTPLVIDLVKRLQANGHQPHILLRGYGGSNKVTLRVDPAIHTAAEVGDEARLLAAIAPVWVGKRRDYSAAAAIIAGATHLVMDDGLQHPYIAKDLSFIVIDRTTGLGNGQCFPAGPLREPFAAAAKRAQAVVVIGAPDQIMPALPSHDLPVLTAQLQSDPLALIHLQTQKLYAFAGIGQPAKFFHALKKAGLELAAVRAFPDHFPYTDQQVAALLARARQLNAQLITTRKDLMRIAPHWHEYIQVMDVQLRWDNENAVDQLLGLRS